MSGASDERDKDPLDGASNDDVDSRFAAIVSGLTEDMSWSATASELDEAATALASSARTPTVGADPDGDRSAPDHSGARAAAERARRRALRKAERAEQVAAFEAERQRIQAEIASDDDHFVPPEPPPLPRPRRRTVAALLLIAAAVVLLGWPGLVQVAPDAVMILGLIMLLTGFGGLLSGLRKRSGDPADGEGWDDGARL